MKRMIFALVLSIVACSKPAPEATPEEATAKYFSALAAGDCDGIKNTSGGDLNRKITANGCAAAFDEARSHGMVFVSATGARPDGRDANARLIDVTIKSDGKDKKIIARVEREDGVWKVATL